MRTRRRYGGTGSRRGHGNKMRHGDKTGTWGRGGAVCPSVRSYVMRMKEFERERRLLQRQKRIQKREAALAAE